MVKEPVRISGVTFILWLNCCAANTWKTETGGQSGMAWARRLQNQFRSSLSLLTLWIQQAIWRILGSDDTLYSKVIGYMSSKIPWWVLGTWICWVTHPLIPFQPSCRAKRIIFIGGAKVVNNKFANNGFTIQSLFQRDPDDLGSEDKLYGLQCNTLEDRRDWEGAIVSHSEMEHAGRSKRAPKVRTSKTNSSWFDSFCTEAENWGRTTCHHEAVSVFDMRNWSKLLKYWVWKNRYINYYKTDGALTGLSDNNIIILYHCFPTKYESGSKSLGWRLGRTTSSNISNSVTLSPKMLSLGRVELIMHRAVCACMSKNRLLTGRMVANKPRHIIY